MTEERLYTTSEAGKELGVACKTVANYCDNGTLNCVVMPGGHRRIPESEVVRLKLKCWGGVNAENDVPTEG